MTGNVRRGTLDGKRVPTNKNSGLPPEAVHVGRALHLGRHGIAGVYSHSPRSPGFTHGAVFVGRADM